MTEDSAITEEYKSLVGVAAEPQVFEVEKGHIKRFAEAVGDPNPLWQDEAYACTSRYGSIIGPPTFLQGQCVGEIARKTREIKSPLPARLNAGTEVECYEPMVPGDVITAQGKLTDVYERQGKSGKLLFLILEVTATNQRGELVAKNRLTFVARL